MFKNTCAYNALSQFIDSRWVSDNDYKTFSKKIVGDTVTIYNHSNIFAGNNEANPIFGLTLGKVTQINQQEITFELPLYVNDNSLSITFKPVEYYPEGRIISSTIALSPDVEVWQSGQPKKLSDVSIGDEVQLVTETKNLVQYYSDIHQNALGKQVAFDAVGIIKTDINTKYVATNDAQIGDPAIVNSIASLRACGFNPAFLCVNVPNQYLGVIYAVDNQRDSDKANQKYQRKNTAAKGIKQYELDGRIKKISSNHVTLETRGSKAAVTVDLPYDAITKYNNDPTAISTPYGFSPRLKAEVGDMVYTYYWQMPSEDHLKIKPGDLQMFSLLEQLQPTGKVVKY